MGLSHKNTLHALNAERENIMSNTIATKIRVDIDTKPPRNRNAKPVYCITDGTVFASGLDAAHTNNTATSDISNVCNGKLKKAKGKQYCFVSDIPMRVFDISTELSNAKTNLSTIKTELSKANADKATLEDQNRLLRETLRNISETITQICELNI